MKLLVVILLLPVFIFGCAGERQDDIETADMEVPGAGAPESAQEVRTLLIEWQRLVDEDGKTCDRCGTTRQEVRLAHSMLKESLSPLAIDVVLEERPMTPAECAEDISQSNRIWIAGRPLEDWLGAEAGMSPCGGCCERELGGDVECRTLIYKGRTYEAIPADLIVRAGLAAAADIGTGAAGGEAGCGPGCTSGCGVTCEPSESCCPGD